MGQQCTGCRPRGGKPDRPAFSARRRQARDIELEESGLTGNDDPPDLAVDREDVFAQGERMPAISCTNRERGRLVRLSDPNLLDPAEIAVGGLDDEAVRLAEPRVCLGHRSHSSAGRFRLLPVHIVRRRATPGGEP